MSRVRESNDAEIREMEKKIQEIVCAPIVRSVNGLLEGDIFLANSWLWSIHSHVRQQQGDTLFSDRPGDEKRQRLAGIANRLQLNYTELLKAEPREEVRIIHDALIEFQKAQQPQSLELTKYQRPKDS